MGKTLDLGRRIEIQPLDKQCHGISIGLYRQEVKGVPHFLLHTYSAVSGAQDRIEFLRHALIVLVGLEDVTDRSGWLRFPCGTSLDRALRRSFLDL